MVENTDLLAIFVVERSEYNQSFLSKSLRAIGYEQHAYFFSGVDDLIDYCSSVAMSHTPMVILLGNLDAEADFQSSIDGIRAVELLKDVPLIVMGSHMLAEDMLPLDPAANIAGRLFNPERLLPLDAA